MSRNRNLRTRCCGHVLKIAKNRTHKGFEHKTMKCSTESLRSRWEQHIRRCHVERRASKKLLKQTDGGGWSLENPHENESVEGRIIFYCYYSLIQIERPLMWFSGQSSWLQIQRPGFDSQHYQIF
jgi:hypothetical protein